MRNSCLAIHLSMLPALILCAAPFLGAARADVGALVKGNSDFALDLYGKLRATEGNLFFSPHSISSALAMTYAGARNATAAQMSAALHLPPNPEALHPAFAELESALRASESEGKVALSVANSLWPQRKYAFLPEYLALIERHYGASITPLDYERALEESRKTINAWVEDKTRKKIVDLIRPGVINNLTRLVLVNAIYFKGNWASPFKPAQTKPAPFFVAPDHPVQTPLMTRTGRFGYAETDSLQALELPYAGGELAMVVILPKKRNGLGEVEGGLSSDALKQWIGRLAQREVVVFLPKFTMTSEFRLDKTLAALGMTDAFAPGTADFSGMDGKPGWLFIGAVVHKAFVEVNEEGTEAAAATGVAVGLTAMPAAPPTFRADHPFLFLIRHKPTGSLLFMGRVSDPTQPGER